MLVGGSAGGDFGLYRGYADAKAAPAHGHLYAESEPTGVGSKAVSVAAAETVADFNSHAVAG